MPDWAQVLALLGTVVILILATWSLFLSLSRDYRDYTFGQLLFGVFFLALFIAITAANIFMLYERIL